MKKQLLIVACALLLSAGAARAQVVVHWPSTTASR